MKISSSAFVETSMVTNCQYCGRVVVCATAFIKIHYVFFGSICFKTNDITSTFRCSYSYQSFSSNIFLIISIFSSSFNESIILQLYPSTWNKKCKVKDENEKSCPKALYTYRLGLISVLFLWHRLGAGKLKRNHCGKVSSQFISDVIKDGILGTSNWAYEC